MSTVQISKVQTSNSGDAILTTTYADDFTTRGNSFLFEKNFSIIAGETINILWDYTTYQSGLGQVYVYPPSFQTTAGPVEVKLYRGTDYKGGSAFTASNPNTLHKNISSGTTLSTGATGTTKGTVAMEYLVGGGSQGNFSAPGSTKGLSFFIASNKRRSLVEIKNNSSETITFHYGQTFFEI